jgi:hypothetical protein
VRPLAADLGNHLCYSVDGEPRDGETSDVADKRGGRVRMNIFVASVLSRVPAAV